MNKSYWVLNCCDAEDAALRRPAVLASHLEYVKNCPFRILLAGPLLAADTGSAQGSLLILEDAQHDAVAAFVRDAPFSVHRIWAEVRIERFTPAISNIAN